MLQLPELNHDQLLKHAFNFAPIGKAIVSLDGRVLKVNKAGLQFLGYSEEEIVNTYFQRITHPDDLHENSVYLNEVIEGKRATYQMVKRFIHKKGHVVWAFLSVSKNSEGDMPFVICQFIDLTAQKSVEHHLKEFETRYQWMVDHSMDLMTKITVDGKFSYISPSCQKLLGYHQDELIGQPITGLYHPEELERLDEFHREFQHMKKGTIVCQAKKKDGSYIWLESTAILMPAVDGKSEEIMSISRDITERKKAEVQLIESEQRFKTLFEHHPDMVFSLNMEMEFTSLNYSCTEITGYSREFILNQLVSYEALVHPEELKEVRGYFERVKKGTVQRFESRIILNSSDTLAVDVTAIPIFINEQVRGILGIARNIQKRKEAERQLKTTREQLESFIDHHTDVILIFNANAELIRVNERFKEVFGWDGKQFIGKKQLEDLEFVPEEEYETFNNRIDRLRKGQSINHFETIRLRKDGSPIHTLISTFLIYEDGKPNGFAATYRDITDQKKAEELMVNSEKLNVAGQLAAGIAHEIRNPLTAIKGFLQFLKHSENASSKPEYFNIMGNEIDRIESIVSELLILAKPQKVNMTVADLKTLLIDVTVLLESQAILNNVQIELDLRVELAQVVCEPNQMKQVFINFIKNAIEAMTKGGKLRIVLERPENTLGFHLYFIDEGIGISEDLIEKLGQPFYTTKEKGTGLGFMVSKKIIEDHKGSVTIESQVNVGTTIKIFLPEKDSKIEGSI